MKDWIVLLCWLFYYSERTTIACTEGDIFLTGEVHPGYTTGWVSICDGTIWRGVCDTGWDMNDASVVCRELGFPPNGGVWSCGNSCYGRDKSLIRFGAINFQCTSNESRLNDCVYDEKRWTAFHFWNCRRFAGVLCSVTPLDTTPSFPSATTTQEPFPTASPDISTGTDSRAGQRASTIDCSAGSIALAVLGAVAAIFLLALVGVVMGWAWSHYKHKKAITKLRERERHDNVYTYSQIPSSTSSSVHYSTLGAQDTPTTAGEGEGVYHHLGEQDKRSKVPILRKSKGRPEGAGEAMYSALQHD